MSAFWHNLEWMPFNVLLACLGVVFGLFFLRSKNLPVRLITFLLWILFLPNTIYLLTDLQHLPKQAFAENNLIYRVLIFMQYITLFVFGVFTYIYGLYPIEKIFQLKKKQNHALKIFLLIVFNFAIALGVGLGRIERTHSWYLFTQPMRVLADVISLFSNMESMLFVLGFGLICNFFYFAFHKTVKNTIRV